MTGPHKDVSKQKEDNRKQNANSGVCDVVCRLQPPTSSGGKELKYSETAGVTMKAGKGWQGETPREPGNQG